MSAEVNIWIQRSDFEPGIDDFKTSSANVVLNTWYEYNWAAELDRQKTRKRNGKDFCPSGMGLVREDGAILHFIGNPENKVSGFYHPPKRGLFRRRPSPLNIHIPTEVDREIAVKAFLKMDDTGIKKFST